MSPWFAMFMAVLSSALSAACLVVGCRYAPAHDPIGAIFAAAFAFCAGAFFVMGAWEASERRAEAASNRSQ